MADAGHLDRRQRPVPRHFLQPPSARRRPGDTKRRLDRRVDRSARTAKSGEDATQARVPRRSKMERFERELDTWFAELAEEEAAGG